MPNRLRRYYHTPSSFQYPRRYSYPPTRDAVPSHHPAAIFAQNRSKKPYSDAIVYPLTEENLAIHTSCMAPQSEEEKLGNLLSFVQSQRHSVLEQQQQQGDEDDTSLPTRRDSIELFRDCQEQCRQQCHPQDAKASIKKSNWLKKFKNWLRTLDHHQQQHQHHSKSESKSKLKNPRHLSWSAGINFKSNQKPDSLPDQPPNNTSKKRDSGLSSLFFFNNHHSSNNESSHKRSSQQQEPQQEPQALHSIPIIRQPKFSSYANEDMNHAFPLNDPSTAKRRSYHVTRNTPTPAAALFFEETSNSRIHPYVAV